MFEAVKFPASVSDLNTGLTDVDRDALSHFRRRLDLRYDRKLEIKNSIYKQTHNQKAFIKTPSDAN